MLLTLLQLFHFFTNVSSYLPQAVSNHITSDKSSSSSNNNNGDKYFESDGLKVVKTKPDKESQAAAISDAVASEDDVIFIHDYTDEEYYGNKDYGDYSNVEKLDEMLVKDTEFKTFVNEKLLQKKNQFQTSWDLKIPVLDGKLRENNGVDPVRSKQYLSSFLQLNEDEFNDLQKSHDKIMESIPDRFPESIEQDIKGRGILYAGGGTYNWLVLLSLKMLRDTGSKLPVEVFIPTDSEYSADLCNRVFPAFGAKCILMSNYIDTKKFKLKGYQLKSMALLLTSFEHVLMLDSDNIPLKNPDVLFINEPYNYKWSSIFLSLYYNVFGPNYFYGLLSQGQAGEGDKETILAAAHKCGLPYYQVQEYIREYGEMTNTYEFHISAMGQYDPILDYIQSQDPQRYKDTRWTYNREKVNYLMHRYSKSETLFLHCNQPKLYPWKIDGKGFRMIHDTAGVRRRLYSKALIQELGYDVEAKIWETMEWMLCKHGDMNIKGMRAPERWCGRVKEQLEFLRGDQLEKGIDAAFAEGMSPEQVQERKKKEEEEKKKEEEKRKQKENKR
ncbi:hypothetical protein BON22_3915 [Cyberlindnera fabianii]|uniref:Alpha-1,2-mannosyltransferase MNN2 n=1 Tax=Cyberlindnera fabianii TaxID=36022 RepID=A0A1V2L2I9_CYBFA|nr:hypothetical protein BON22_3915 [Cyberlindnera fabianii]